MGKNGVFLTNDGLTPPLQKAGSLTVRYIGWWNVPAKRQNTIVLEVYEKE